MYLLLGISLSLAVIMIVNFAIAIFVSAAWNVLSRFVEKMPSVVRGRAIFILRVLPMVAAMLLVTFFIIPAYVLYEPYSTGEVVSLKLASLAVLALLGFGIALYRILRTAWLTRGLMSEWMTSATKLDVAGIDVPLYRFHHKFPVVAVVGMFRPRIFVASNVLEALDHDEFNATLAHEFGHLSSKDNLKRGILLICRDLLILPVGKRLESAWSDNAEEAADEFASLHTNGAAIDLASALVKIGKLVPAGSYPAMPAGAYLIDEHAGDISSRIRRLLKINDGEIKMSAKSGSRLSQLWLAIALVVSFAAMVPFINNSTLAFTHEGIEALVKFLQ